MSGSKIRKDISDDGAPNEVLDLERREAPWLHGGPAQRRWTIRMTSNGPFFHLLTVMWPHGGTLRMSVTAFLMTVSQRMAPKPDERPFVEKDSSFAGGGYLCPTTATGDSRARCHRLTINSP